MEAARSPWPALGVLLVRDELVTPEQLEHVLTVQHDERGNRISGRRLGEVLVQEGLVTSTQIARLVAEQHELPFVDLDEPDSITRLAVRMPEELARRLSALPIRMFPDGSLLVVVADPAASGSQDEIRRAVGVPVRMAVAAPDAIDAAIEAAAANHQFAYAADADPPLGEGLDFVEPPLSMASLNGHPEEAAWPVLGSLLLRDGLVTEDELDAALAQQRLSSTRRLGEILMQRGSLTEAQIARALAEQHELRFIDLDEYDVDPVAAARMPAELARQYRALPISFLPDGSLLVVVADPTTAVQSDDLRAALDEPFELAVAPLADIASAIAELHDAPSGAAPALEEAPEPASLAVAVADLEDVVDATEARDEDEVPSAPELALVPPEPEPAAVVVDEITSALERGASAVHVVSGPEGLVVTARIAGMLGEIATISSSAPESLAAALGELAGVGRMPLTVGERVVELRPTVLPTVLGERVTFRVVDDRAAPDSFGDLFAETEGSAVEAALAGSAGLVLACSPTPAGRSSALYALLDALAEPGRTVLSVEDPVERLVRGVDQAEVDPRAGITFETGLHAILRSDPDVAVVGELLDRETTRLATRSAVEHCLVVSTLDAETTAAGMRLLLDLGVEPRTLASALSCVVAERVLRPACTACRTSGYATPEELAALRRPASESGRRLVARTPGCESCDFTGHRGWKRVFEVLPLTEQVRKLVAAGASAREIEDAAIAGGMSALTDTAIELCLDGVVTVSEIERVPRVSS